MNSAQTTHHDRLKVSRYNYPSQFGNDLQPLLESITGLLINGPYVLTQEVSQFEAQFAEYLGVSHARGVNSGTDALVVALLASGVGRGDEVITQANTFNATVAAICVVGAKPVLVDADEESFLIDGSQVESVITPRTLVVLPVHLYGKPTPLDSLAAIAEKHGLCMIEDAAQAHGARINGRAVGSFGSAACFSFHPSKNLAAAGDAGAVVTNSPAIDDRVCRYRELGQRGQDNHVLVGLNSKMDAIQALVLSWKLPRLDEWNRRRRTIAGWYRERLCDLPLRFQSAAPAEEHVYHLFQVRSDCRDQLFMCLRANGVEAVIRYPTPIHLQPAFADYGWRKGQFPVSERLANELLCLPIRPDMSLAEVDYISDVVRRFFKGVQTRSAH
jgi:dTDP-4-amino-4,6-dideoxygalactose transaminase